MELDFLSRQMYASLNFELPINFIILNRLTDFLEGTKLDFWTFSTDFNWVGVEFLLNLVGVTET